MCVLPNVISNIASHTTHSQVPNICTSSSAHLPLCYLLHPCQNSHLIAPSVISTRLAFRLLVLLMPRPDSTLLAFQSSDLPCASVCGCSTLSLRRIKPPATSWNNKFGAIYPQFSDNYCTGEATINLVIHNTQQSTKNKKARIFISNMIFITIKN